MHNIMAIAIAIASTTPRARKGPRKATRSNKRSLDEATERALLELLLSPIENHFRSKEALEALLVDVAPNPALRLKVRNRRTYLLRLQKENVSAFLLLCEARGVTNAAELAAASPTGTAPSLDSIIATQMTNLQETLQMASDERNKLKQSVRTLEQERTDLRKELSKLKEECAQLKSKLSDCDCVCEGRV
jgi:hypothetical protein